MLIMMPMALTWSSGTSSSTIDALLPPSSSWSRFSVGAAAAMIRRPVGVDPVKVTMSTIG